MKGRQPLTPGELRTHINVSIPRELRERVIEHRKSINMSASAFIRSLIEKELAAANSDQ